MITLHHLNHSRSQRILWLLEELNVDYEIKRYDRDPVTIRAPKSLKAVHPLGKSPVITDSNGDITVAESGAIVEYLIATYDKAKSFQSDSSESQRSIVYWSHFAEGSLMPPLLMALLFDKVKESPMPFFVKPIARGIANKVMGEFVQPEIDSILGFIEQSLSDREWFSDVTPTGSDFQMSFPLEALVAKEKINAQTHPNICAFVKRCQSRPAYLAALEKGGDYEYGPQ
jgi:glutathione S-transferase